MSRRLTEALRAALGHDGTTPEPAPEPPAEIPSMEELSARLDAQLAAPIEYVPPDLRDVTSLAGAALALGTHTVNDAARELIAMGKAAPTHLLYDANVLLASEQKDWDPKLHPRDRNGRFIEVGAILNLLGSVGGGRGTVVGNGPNNHVIVRKADGTEVDVPANQTYTDSSTQDRIGKPGQLAGEVGKPGTFADTPAAAAPKPKPAPEGRILPTDLPDNRDELFRALRSNRAVGNDDDRIALNAAASAIGATGDGRALGASLADRSGDQRTSDRIAGAMDTLDKIADELDADGITVTTADGTKLSDYLRDYAAGFRANHYVQPAGEGTPRVRPGSIAEAMVTRNVSPNKRTFTSALMDAMAEGGFTFSPQAESFRADGFAVAVPDRGQSFAAGELTAEALDAYIDANWDELSANPNLHLGGWVEDDGTAWLDLSEVYDTRDEAYAAGAERGEIAVADIAAFASGEDGTIPIAYAQKPPAGPAADKWDDPESGILKEGAPDGGQRQGAEADRARPAQAGRVEGTVQGTNEGGTAPTRGPGGADDVAGQPGDGDTAQGGVTFTEDEMLTALVHYKGVAYARINNWLRDGTEPEPWQMMDGTEKESAPEIKRDAAALAAYIAQHPTEEPMTVFRGASGDWTADLTVGSVIEDKGFISTTEDEITATEFAGVFANDPSMAFANDGYGTVFEIDMPAGTLAINYGQHDPENEFEADDEENEWIVAPGSKIEITEDLGVQEDGARKFKAKLTAPTTEDLVTPNVAPDTGVPDVLGTPEPSRAEARGAQVVTEPDAADPSVNLSSLRNRRMALRQAAAAADAGDYERSDAILARLPARTPTGTPEATGATAGDAAVANRGGAVMPESGPPGVRPQVDALDPQFDVAQLRGRREALRQAADAAAGADYDRADAIIARLSTTERPPSPAADALTEIPVTGRPDGSGTADDPIDVGDDVDLAVQLLADGKHVRLNQPDEVATLLDKVREIVAESKAKGQEAPTFDLCLVSVPGTNLFCAENQGIKRIEMPQLSGIPLPGTPADAMEKNSYGGVDLAEDFVAALQEVGVAVTDETRPASHLRASQMELDGAKVSGIANAMENADGPDELNDAPIFVTRDGYVIDGHHRWAAKVGLDVADNELGDVDMNVRVVDMDIGAALDFANAFATRMGIPGADVTDNPVAEAEAKPDVVEFAGETLTKGVDSLYDHLIPDGQGGYKLSPEREALHDQIIKDTLAGVPRSQDPSFFMLGGGPAAGKSTMLGDAALEGVPDDEGMLNGEKAAVVVNPDNVKVVLPEYTSMVDGGQAEGAAGFVHEESSFLAKRIQATALEGQRDVVLDGTGDSSLLKLLKKVKQARDAGYAVKGFYATIPTDVAWERADARAQQTGRHVRESVLRDTHSAVSRVVPEAATHFDEFTLFDTMNGARPIARATRDGEIEVLDEASYSEFLDKGFEQGTESLESLQARLEQTTSPSLRAALQRQIDALSTTEAA